MRPGYPTETSGRSRCSSAARVGAGGPCRGWPSSPWCSPTCPPRPSGAWTSSRRCGSCLRPGRGCPPPSPPARADRAARRTALPSPSPWQARSPWHGLRPGASPAHAPPLRLNSYVGVHVAQVRVGVLAVEHVASLVDPVEAPRRVGLHAVEGHCPVLLDIQDVWVPDQVDRLRLGRDDLEATKGEGVDVLHGPARLGGQFLGEGGDARCPQCGAVLEPHDKATGHGVWRVREPDHTGIPRDPGGDVDDGGEGALLPAAVAGSYLELVAVPGDQPTDIGRGLGHA